MVPPASSRNNNLKASTAIFLLFVVSHVLFSHLATMTLTDQAVSSEGRTEWGSVQKRVCVDIGHRTLDSGPV